MVDVKDFLKDVQKRKKRSQMEDHYDSLLTLQAENCTLEVMQEFLRKNGVTVSKGAISKFLKRRETGKDLINQTQQKDTKHEDLRREGQDNNKQKSFEEIQKEISAYKKENYDE